MKILFQNARILTMKEGERLFRGDLLVKDDRIVEVGERVEAEADRVIDCEGNLLLPGFKNAHTHAAMSFARSLADDLPLQEWLFEEIFPKEAKLQRGDQYALSKVSMLECLSSGITAMFDMYFSTEEIRQAAHEMGMRVAILGTVTSSLESVAQMKQDYLSVNGHDDLCTYQMGYHAEYTASPEVLDALSKTCHELHAPCFTHISETEKEVKECFARHGMSPAAYMESKGLLDYGGGGFHCCHFSQEDAAIFARHEASIISCPGSNAKLASGIAPITMFDEMGLNIAIGTDGASSNNGLDMFYEMRLLTVLQKLANKDAASYPAYKVLRAATVNGAKAMGLNDCLYLEKGQKADIVMIDLSRPSMQPLNDMEDNLVYSGGKDCVKMTMVNGVIRYLDGRFYVEGSLPAIYEEAQRITDRLKGE